jgi:hypothetical protein
MNVGFGYEAVQCNFWEYLFRIFSVANALICMTGQGEEAKSLEIQEKAKAGKRLQENR